MSSDLRASVLTVPGMRHRMLDAGVGPGDLLSGEDSPMIPEKGSG